MALRALCGMTPRSSTKDRYLMLSRAYCRPNSGLIMNDLMSRLRGNQKKTNDETNDVHENK